MDAALDDVALFLEEAGELLRDCEEAMLLMEASPDPALVNRVFRCAHTLKGTSSMLGFAALAEFAHHLENLLARIRDGALAVTPTITDCLLEGLDLLRVHVTEVSGGAPVDAARRDVALHRIAQALRASVPAPSPPPVTSAMRAPPEGVAATPTPREDGAASIRVPIEKVDRLVNLVGELVTTQSAISMLLGDFDVARLAEVREVVAQMDRYCREMQERVLGVRMLPVRTVFSRFQRVVRDLSGATGKRIELRIHGEETELDKTVIERIADPLTHLIRNAVDHGIEPPAARVAQGKSEVAQLTLTAYQKGGRIFIEVADDGRGLDRARILARARERGLVAPEARLTDAQIDDLIFLPGFSTVEKVTDLSGRGVGMDVVLRNVTALKGTISILSEPGAGTCFQIKLPLTLAILDGLALRVGAQVLIAPLVTVVELVTARSQQVRSLVGGGEFADVRGQFMPLVRARDFFRTGADEADVDDGLLVIIDAGDRRVALLVDEVLGQYQVVQKSLEQHYRSVHGIAGATILGDGRVALIVDPTALRPREGARGYVGNEVRASLVA
jgi:two-component system, chemotaxis family, sensor kinase CheA